IVACRVAHRLAHDTGVIRQLTFTSLVSQAGVAIGLATVAGAALGEIGTGIATLAIAVIGTNEIVGPILFQCGAAEAGELGTAEPARGAPRRRAERARPSAATGCRSPPGPGVAPPRR